MVRPMRRLFTSLSRSGSNPAWAGFAALIVVGALTGCTSASSGSSSPPSRSTQRNSPVLDVAATIVSPRYSPFRPNGAVVSGLTIVHSLRGTCAAHGALLPGTYLCHPGGNRRRDVGLCYPRTGSNVLMCVVSPVAQKATRFTSDGPLATPTVSPPGAPPSILELANGQICGSSQVFDKAGTALANIGGHHATYLCDGNQVSAVYGPINRATRTWTVQTTQTQAGTGAHTLTKYDVKRSWR
jgi:hypothetical protein